MQMEKETEIDICSGAEMNPAAGNRTGTGRKTGGKGTAVAIGKFDGTHIGHQKLIRELVRIAGENGLVPTVLLINNGKTPVEEKEEQKKRLFSFGVEKIEELELDEDLKLQSAGSFLEEILLNRLSMKYLIGGKDISFGYQKKGNAVFLKEASRKYGFRYQLIDKVELRNRDPENPGGQVVSSTLLHETLAKGDMEKVLEIMGKNYEITGIVEHGRHLGTDSLGVPTLNQRVCGDRQVPPYGVYVSRVTILPEDIDHKQTGKTGTEGLFSAEESGKAVEKVSAAETEDSCYGISDLGKKPSINEGRNPLMLETHLLDVEPGRNLYGRVVKTELLHFVRPEKQFGTLEELMRQIREKDIPQAYDYIRQQETGITEP